MMVMVVSDMCKVMTVCHIVNEMRCHSRNIYSAATTDQFSPLKYVLIPTGYT